MKNSPFYTIGFAAAVGLVCATALTVVGQFVRPRLEANAEADQKLGILRALDPDYPADAPAKKVIEDFAARVEPQKAGEPRYTYRVAGQVAAVAVAFEGKGLWKPIKGYLALEPDLETIRGIAVTEQEETPGLGGEIGSQRWQDQWSLQRRRREQRPPLRIYDGRGERGIRILKYGGATAANEIDGITGATITGEAMERMINEAIAALHAEEAPHGR